MNELCHNIENHSNFKRLTNELCSKIVSQSLPGPILSVLRCYANLHMNESFDLYVLCSDYK